VGVWWGCGGGEVGVWWGCGGGVKGGGGMCMDTLYAHNGVNQSTLCAVQSPFLLLIGLQHFCLHLTGTSLVKHGEAHHHITDAVSYVIRGQTASSEGQRTYSCPLLQFVLHLLYLFPQPHDGHLLVLHLVGNDGKP